MFHKQQTQAVAGESCGILLSGVQKGAIQRGQVMCAPGTVGVAKYDLLHLKF